MSRYRLPCRHFKFVNQSQLVEFLLQLEQLLFELFLLALLLAFLLVFLLEFCELLLFLLVLEESFVELFSLKSSA